MSAELKPSAREKAVEPGRGFRRQAGPYDSDTCRPHYDVQVIVPDAEALR